ncbi:MAG TPA: hypothetical protein VJ761_16365 [Ktedonobacteraceae bacterium]|nr:hypothetical protein [Ktedonobacteraceae bacterium]
MRQGDGADLLGASDPRSANIGVIYVAPNDNRQSVLAAILTQDKLGRKQVAVVLPGQNKAFQRPVDFDGLKNMRRGLKTQIVFVAPPGPGPAEFARQRRFPVFSSTESFAQSLRAENGTPASDRRGLFGRRQKPTNGAGPSSPANAVGDEQTEPLPGAFLPVPVPLPEERNAPPPVTDDPLEENQNGQQQNEPHDSHGAALGGAGLAAGLGLGALAAHAEGDASALADDDPDFLPPAPEETQPTPSQQPVNTSAQTELGSTPANGQGNADPVIILFPSSQPRRRSTAKLPAAPLVPVPPVQSNVPPAAPPARRGNTGKRAPLAAGAFGAGVGAGAAFAAQAPGTGGAPPPTGGSAGGPGGGGGGGSRRRTSRTLLVILLILLTLLLLAGIAFAAPGGIGRLSNVIPGSTVTARVTITPVSKDEKDSFVLTAVTGKPDSTQRQVQARILKATSGRQSSTAQSTGSIPGAKASGTLQFTNLGTGSIFVPAGTLTGSDGVQVFHGAFTLPLTTINVTGTAVNVGASGNIAASDIRGTCCGNSNIFVRNQAFSGGRDPQPNSVVQQSDITSATTALQNALTPGTKATLQKQVHANEQTVNSVTCTPTVSPNHRAGEQAKTVTVTGTITCTQEVYDQQGAKTLAANLLKAEAQKNLDSTYTLLNNNIVTHISTVSIIDAHGTVSLDVSAEGIWVYQFSDAMKQNLAKLIAGKSQSAAKALLLQQMGVSDAQITISSGTTLPTNSADITIVINGVTGLPGTGSPTATVPAPIGTPASPTATPSTEPGLGGAGGS